MTCTQLYLVPTSLGLTDLCSVSFSVSVFKEALEKNETRIKEGKTVYPYVSRHM